MQCTTFEKTVDKVIIVKWDTQFIIFHYKKYPNEYANRRVQEFQHEIET